jgi:hypothetical protein
MILVMRMFVGIGKGMSINKYMNMHINMFIFSRSRTGTCPRTCLSTCSCSTVESREIRNSVHGIPRNSVILFLSKFRRIPQNLMSIPTEVRKSGNKKFRRKSVSTGFPDTLDGILRINSFVNFL